jgi:hypothetical protein
MTRKELFKLGFVVERYVPANYGTAEHRANPWVVRPVGHGGVNGRFATRKAAVAKVIEDTTEDDAEANRLYGPDWRVDPAPEDET